MDVKGWKRKLGEVEGWKNRNTVGVGCAGGEEETWRSREEMREGSGGGNERGEWRRWHLEKNDV